MRDTGELKKRVICRAFVEIFDHARCDMHRAGGARLLEGMRAISRPFIVACWCRGGEPTITGTMYGESGSVRAEAREQY